MIPGDLLQSLHGVLLVVLFVTRLAGVANIAPIVLRRWVDVFFQRNRFGKVCLREGEDRLHVSGCLLIRGHLREAEGSPTIPISCP